MPTKLWKQGMDRICETTETPCFLILRICASPPAIAAPSLLLNVRCLGAIVNFDVLALGNR